MRGLGAPFPPWACTGLVLLDGEPVAAWGRREGRITILALASLDDESRHEIEAEALGMPVPGTRSQVLWRDGGPDRYTSLKKFSPRSLSSFCASMLSRKSSPV